MRARECERRVQVFNSFRLTCRTWCLFALPPEIFNSVSGETKFYDLASGALPDTVLFFLRHCPTSFARKSLSAFNLWRMNYEGCSVILSDIVFFCRVILCIFISFRPPAIARAPGLMPRIAAPPAHILGVISTYYFLHQPVLSWFTSNVIGGVFSRDGIRGIWVFYLGRSLSLVAEASKLVTGGPYRLVRHPLYLGGESRSRAFFLQHISVSRYFCLLFRLPSSFTECLAKKSPREISRNTEYVLRTL